MCVIPPTPTIEYLGRQFVISGFSISIHNNLQSTVLMKVTCHPVTLKEYMRHKGCGHYIKWEAMLIANGSLSSELRSLLGYYAALGGSSHTPEYGHSKIGIDVISMGPPSHPHTLQYCIRPVWL